MAVTAPKRQKTPAVASEKVLPPSPFGLAAKTEQYLKTLPPVNFILMSYDSPFSLPMACSQILYQEKVLDQFGRPKPLAQNEQLSSESELKIKLTYAVLQSQVKQQLFQFFLIPTETPNFPQSRIEAYKAFGQLAAETYSLPITTTFFANRYPQLFSSRLELTREPSEVAINLAKQTFIKKMNDNKNGLRQNLAAYLDSYQKRADAIIDQLLFIAPNHSFSLPDLDITINLNKPFSLKLNYYL